MAIKRSFRNKLWLKIPSYAKEPQGNYFFGKLGSRDSKNVRLTFISDSLAGFELAGKLASFEFIKD